MSQEQIKQIQQLKTLVKSHQAALDDKRRELRALQDKADGIVAHIERLKVELAKERELVTSNVDVSFNYGTYSDANKSKREQLAEERMAMQSELDEAEEAMRDAFRELKKYEITLERREEEWRKEQEKREQTELDEMAGNAWQRSKKEES